MLTESTGGKGTGLGKGQDQGNPECGSLEQSGQDVRLGGVLPLIILRVLLAAETKAQLGAFSLTAQILPVSWSPGNREQGMSLWGFRVRK